MNFIIINHRFKFKEYFFILFFIILITDIFSINCYIIAALKFFEFWSATKKIYVDILNFIIYGVYKIEKNTLTAKMLSSLKQILK
jgi:hypothetical protein